MKKIVLLFAGLVAIAASACQTKKQNPMETITKGKMEVVELQGFKLHVYRTLDALGDASFIVEGKDGLVTLEHPLFKENIAEFDAYIKALDKPIVKVIANYHTGGTADWHEHDLVMVKGMEEFEKSSVYAGMLGHFEQVFGEAIDVRAHKEAEEVAFGQKVNYAGVEFSFAHGASSDFPGASIVIGGQVYYTHWTPAKAHMSHLQIVSAAAIEAEIEETKKELASGCEVFVGSHGGRASKEDVAFKLTYLEKAKELREVCATASEWEEGMKNAFPGLAGEEGLSTLSAAIYQ